MTYIGYDQEHLSIRSNTITNTITTIMWYGKCRYHHITQFYSLGLINYSRMFWRQLGSNTIISIYATMYFLCSIYGQMVVMSQMSDSLYMVGMIMRDKYGINVRQHYTLLL
jgi:hypothetical protein